jgi:hypothetical protein
MRLLDIELVTPDRHSLGAGPPVEVHNAGIRLDIASSSATSSNRCLADHLARPSPA